MRVTRTMPDEGWVPTANAAARNHLVSWRARGLLTELLSYPDGFDMTVDKLVALGRAAGGKAEGRNAVQIAMAELVSAGYVRYIRTSDDRGRWTTVIDVSDTPRPTGNPAVGGPAGRGTGGSVTRQSEDRAVTKKTDLKTDTKTEDQKTYEEYSTSLTSFAAAADAAADDQFDNSRVRRIYAAIDSMTPEARRNGLLAFERKRPAIYRDCRRKALAQLKREGKPLTDQEASERVDRLSYKYAAVHYQHGDATWFLKPLCLTGYDLGRVA